MSYSSLTIKYYTGMEQRNIQLSLWFQPYSCLGRISFYWIALILYYYCTLTHRYLQFAKPKKSAYSYQYIHLYLYTFIHVGDLYFFSNFFLFCFGREFVESGTTVTITAHFNWLSFLLPRNCQKGSTKSLWRDH